MNFLSFDVAPHIHTPNQKKKENMKIFYLFL